MQGIQHLHYDSTPDASDHTNQSHQTGNLPHNNQTNPTAGHPGHPGHPGGSQAQHHRLVSLDPGPHLHPPPAPLPLPEDPGLTDLLAKLNQLPQVHSMSRHGMT